MPDASRPAPRQLEDRRRAAASVPAPSRGRWRGVPAATRTAERRASLIDVAFDLLGSHGIARTSVRRVCEVARLNPRYFYESFDDLDALLLAVFDRTAAEAFGVFTSAVEAAVASGQDDEHVVRAGIGAFVRHLAGDPRRARVLLTEGFTSEALGRRRFQAMHEQIEIVLSDARAEAAAPGGTGRVPSLVVVATHVFVGGMAELLASWVAGHVDLTIDEVVDDLASLFLVLGDYVSRTEQRRETGESRRR